VKPARPADDTTATPAATPADKRPRLLHLDVIRGIAMLGILPVNLSASSGRPSHGPRCS
jgi:uncharacterized membrane protein YeiB